MLKGIVLWLRGKKTYFCAFALFCAGGAEYMGWLHKGTADALKAAFAAGGLASFYAMVKRASNGE